MSTVTNFETNVEERLQRLIGRGVRPGLERINRLLADLGNPQKKIKLIHVGGTNGKGSVSRIIAQILTCSGYRTGHFTSPHLHSYCERFMIDEAMIPPQRLEQYLDRIENLTKLWPEEDRPTEFEILTAAAFVYFYEEAVDFTVLEVGMGGIYDSTNCIVPLVSVITNVDLDHTAFLGSDIKSIAWNKAGIIKPGVPVILGKMHPEAQAIIEAAAAEQAAPVYTGEAVRVEGVRREFPGQAVNIDGGGWNFKALPFALSGSFQRENLATALLAARKLKDQGLAITETAVAAALSTVRMPGRMEVLSSKPLVLCDVAHNPHGACALAQSLAEWLPGTSKVMVIGIVDDKDKRLMLQALAQNTRVCIVTRPSGHRNRNWQETAELFQEMYPAQQVIAEPDIGRAVQLALDLLQPEEFLLLTGSFYLMDQGRSVLRERLGTF